MLKRLKLSPQALMALEAGLIGLFFIQALRFLVGMLYTQTAGASAMLALQSLNIDPLPPGGPDPTLVRSEISFTIAMLGLPLLTLILGKVRPLIFAGTLLVVVGRALMNLQVVLTPTAAAALVVGGGLFYLAFLVRWRANHFPIFFVAGIGADQLFRAAGNTLDPSWAANYANVQIGLSFIAALIAFIALVWSETRPQPPMPGPEYGLLPFWGGVGIGGLLFLQLALLAIPNAIAGRADYDYAIIVPFLTAATLLPLVPSVRSRVMAFLNTFDAGLRGWLWMLLIILLLVFGTRLQGVIGAITLILAQFGATMIWWWLLRRRTERDRSFNGLWLILAMAIFAILIAFDTFTYDYAYVRGLSGNLAFLNDIVVPLMRGFQGLGLVVLGFAAFLAALPMTQIRGRMSTSNASAFFSLAALVLVIAASFAAGYLARPPVVPGAGSLAVMRVGTFNIHGGTDEYFTASLDRIANTIFQSGANVVMLQEAEAGRITSFGVDQPLWLARRLGMDRRFFPTVEGLRGLAVLSNVPIAYDDGVLLDGISEQTGLQRVQILPEPDHVIEVYNTWLSYLTEPTGDLTLADQEQDQQRQLNQIFQIIADQHPNGVLGRTILGGTFNNVPDSPLLEQLTSVGFVDPFAGYPIELSATLVRSGVPRARLDYILLRNLTPAEGVGVIDTPASDHRMVVVGVLVE